MHFYSNKPMRSNGRKTLLLFVHVLAAVVCYYTSEKAGAAERPNVILVMTDDQGYGDLSCHGNPVVRTPNLDQLYAESLRLTDFHVAPMCTPTRGQLLTGVDALRNKAMNVSSGRTLLRRDLPTMANFFADGGYATGIFGKWHLGDNYPYRPQDRGFERAIWFPSSHISSVPDYWENDYFDDTYFDGEERKQLDGYCTDVFFRKAIEWMGSQVKQDKPFFAYIPLNAPHGPLFVPDKYRAPVRERLQQALDKLPELPPQRRRALVSFLAMIENIDENMGRIEEFLNEEDLRDNTIVIFLTDNGSTMGERYYNAGMRGAKISLWEGGHRVPCFIRWPSGELREPGDVSELTQVQDVLPTLIDLCELDAPKNTKFDGASLAKLLRDPDNSLADRMIAINYSRMPWESQVPVPGNAAVPRKDRGAVLWKRWRLLRDKELYNVADDPAQQRDVYAEHPEIVAQMRDFYDQWWNGVKDQVNVPERIVIGDESENPTLLTACEWYNVIVDQQRQVRVGDKRNSTLHLEVAEPGKYTFELRRWPREANLPLQAGMPATHVTDGVYAEGAALPIAEAQLEIGEETHRNGVSSGDLAATFEVELNTGPIDVRTSFMDEEGKELCGAYYLYVERK